jgi:hypothetical protein
MARKSIAWVGYDDFSIHEGDAKIGTIRVKPSGILWAPKGKHSWFKVSIEEFADFAEKLNKSVKK